MKTSLSNVKSLDTQRAGLKIFYFNRYDALVSLMFFYVFVLIWRNVIYSSDKSDTVVWHRPGCNNHLLVLCLRSTAKFQQKSASCYFLMRIVGGPNSSEERVSIRLKSLYCGSCLSGKSQSIYADESVILQRERNQLNRFAMLLFFLFFLSTVVSVWTTPTLWILLFFCCSLQVTIILIINYVHLCFPNSKVTSSNHTNLKDFQFTVIM